MMPAYRSMDSHPYQRNQMPPPYYYHPGIEAIHPQMKMDPSKSPFAYEQPWPYTGSYGFQTPAHFCCGRHNFPGYCSFRSSYPQYLAPSPIYYFGGCPAYVEPLHFPYTPPPHYTMELPRYEYDKCMPREYHCCGCPNHPCNQNGGQSLKIEEEEPDVEKKVNDALEPIQLKNSPYPFVWIPPEYMTNRELKKPVAAEVDEQDKLSRTRNPPEYYIADRQDPKVWNGWIPFDMNNLPNIIHNEHGRKNQNWQDDNNNRRESKDGRLNQNQQGENTRREFPFPVIWMPYSKQEDDGRTSNQESTPILKSSKEAPHSFKSVPVNFYASDDITNNNRMSKDYSRNNDGSNMDKVTKEKSIPVKHMEFQQGNTDLEGNDRREKNIPVKQVEERMADKDSQSSIKRPSTSPQKTSKLPPVCLRVDPLPRKKNGNGSSRTPSPPSSKEHSKSEAEAGGRPKTFASSSMNDKVHPDIKLQNASNIRDKDEPKVRSVEVLEKTGDNNDADQRNGSQSQISFNMPSEVHDNSSASTGTKESWTNVDEYKTVENKADSMIEDKATEEREATDSTKLISDKCGKDRKVLSDAEAATLIQAAYRGFQVRKWEPLKKLSQIAEVRKQVMDVRDRIQASEASSELQNDHKQNVTIGETIMRLLLKLDTIQGLHPNCREIRKSLARELIYLQEKLDSIMVKKSQQQLEVLFARIPVEDTPLDAQNRESMLDQEEVAAPGKDYSESTSHDMVEQSQYRSSMKDGNASSEEETSGSVTHSVPASYEDAKLGPVNCSLAANSEDEKLGSVDHSLAAGSISEELTSDNHNLPADYDKSDAVSNELPMGLVDEDAASSVDDSAQNEAVSDIHAMDKLPVGLVDEDAATFVDNSVRDRAILEMHPMAELPVGVVDEDSLAAGSISEGLTSVNCNLPADYGKSESSSPLDAVSNELPVGLVDEDAASSVDDSAQNEAVSEIHVMDELPVGLVDEDAATSVDNSVRDGAASEMYPMAELPVGLVEDSLVAGSISVELPFVIHDPPADYDTSESSSPLGVVSKELPVGSVDEDVVSSADDSARNEAASDIHVMDELPVELVDEDAAMSVEDSACEERVSEIHAMAEPPKRLVYEKAATAVDDSAQDEAVSEIHAMTEQPVGLLDEDVATSETNRHDETKISKGVQQAVEECNVTARINYSADDISNKTQTKQQQLEEQAEVQSTEELDDWVKVEFQKDDEPKQDASLNIEVDSQSGEAASNDIVAEQETGAGVNTTKILADEKRELSVAPPVAKEPPTANHDGGLDDNKKLNEENEKLRELMQKLLEAGNEQLSLISDLTGRVKDLEKKLARKKILRTKRYGGATSRSSCMKSSNNPSKGRAVGVAM